MQSKAITNGNSRLIQVTLTLAIMAAVLLPGFPGEAQTRKLLGTFTADTHGRISGTVKIPEDTNLGPSDLVASGTAAADSGGDSDSGYGGEQLLVSDATVEPGQEIQIESHGWLPGTQVRVTLEPAGQASALGKYFGGGVAFAQANREVSARLRVVEKNSRSDGSTATGAGSTTTGSAATSSGGSPRAASNATPAGKGNLARTGFTVLPWFIAGVAALGIGAIFILGVRRKKRGGASPGLPQV